MSSSSFIREAGGLLLYFFELNFSCSATFIFFTTFKFFACMQVTEVFNFSQDDLLTEDMMILDTHSEIFIWIGHCVETKEKQMAFEIGQVIYDKLILLV
jgi:hypothetical protein